MNTAPALKLISLLSRVALLGLVTFLVGLASDTQALALFAFAASSLVMLIVVADYAPRPAAMRQRPDNVLDFAPAPSPQSEKLAA